MESFASAPLRPGFPSEKLPLLPKRAALPLFFLAFVLPNLIFSGPWFYSTLHLMKWAVVFFPLAIAGMAAGYVILRRGTKATGFRLDGFAVLWLFLLLYVTMQPFWSGLRSPVTFFSEWFFFAGLWLIYVLVSSMEREGFLPPLLWGSLANCALSVLFAELQVRGLSDPFFFILPTPGHYIANTGQQNMFSLWLAIGGLNGAALMLRGERRNLKGFLLMLLLTVNFWGLISTTSRSGILAFASGFFALAALTLRNRAGRWGRRLLAVFLLFIAVFGMNIFLNEGRWGILLYKMDDIVKNPLSIANRDSIWATSWTMFTERPLRGVGLGQYKWHYLDAQREMLKRWPHLKWQYTHWAHNEFLQWFAESGLIGGIIFLFLWLWWGISALGVFLKKKALSPEALWGSAMICLFLFNALWTRPFHRIENVLWLSLAFAVTNREVLFPLFLSPSPEEFEKGGRLLGGVMCLVSLLGIIYLGSGMGGDRQLRLASNPELSGEERLLFIEKASRNPMITELAEQQRAYALIALGQEQKSPELVSEGLNELMVFFTKQPHVKELGYLTGWSKKLENEPLYQEFRSYGMTLSGE
ncbi:MAG: O-antigen ligase family protein [Synergistaceae bacterium]|nr:O-antigen ligase family protein [Synergistaceae bacterium]